MILILAGVLFLVGLCLSAGFSGSETGFYRVTRVRLLVDGLAGDGVSRVLLWMTNHPALFVATSLIGTNLANYCVSLSIVMTTQLLWGDGAYVIHLMAPLLLSPVVFVYGELLPKNLFLRAPNLLLRRVGPIFILFAVLFAPLSALLWLFGRLLESILGGAPLRIRLALARNELRQVLEEGHDAGILRPAQRDLAQTLFSLAPQSVMDFTTPLENVAVIERGTSISEVMQLARKQGFSAAPVVDQAGQTPVGYIRIVDLYLDDSEVISDVRPLLEISSLEPHIAALIRMQTGKEELAAVVGNDGEMVGLLYAERLTEPLLRS